MRVTVIAFLLATSIASSVQAQVREGADSCGANDVLDMIGQTAEVVTRVDFERQVRVIEWGASMSVDFDMTRINFDLDANGTITAIWCG